MLSNIKKMTLLLIFCAALTACVSDDAVKEEIIADPDISVSEVRTTSISFKDIRLEMEILINNPNPVGIELTGLDYDLQIEDLSFLRESREESVSLEAYGSERVIIPVTIGYEELFASSGSLISMADADYSIFSGFLFSLPVRGDSRQEISHQGSLPLVHMPRFSFDSLYVADLGLMGADIIVLMSGENPNNFDVTLNDFEGVLNVNKLRWADLKSLESVDFPSGETRELGFQFRLDFLSRGRTVRDLLSGNEELFYGFDGQILLESDLEGMEVKPLPLLLAGSIDLLKPDSTTEGKHSSEKIEQSIEDNLVNIFGTYSH